MIFALAPSLLHFPCCANTSFAQFFQSTVSCKVTFWDGPILGAAVNVGRAFIQKDHARSIVRNVSAPFVIGRLVKGCAEKGLQGYAFRTFKALRRKAFGLPRKIMNDSIFVTPKSGGKCVTYLKNFKELICRNR